MLKCALGAGHLFLLDIIPINLQRETGLVYGRLYTLFAWQARDCAAHLSSRAGDDQVEASGGSMIVGQEQILLASGTLDDFAIKRRTPRLALMVARIREQTCAILTMSVSSAQVARSCLRLCQSASRCEYTAGRTVARHHSGTTTM